jgi:hypothetical protein
MLILKILMFCTFISFTNLFGLHPQFDNPSEWFDRQSKSVKVIISCYAIIVIIGWLHLIGLLIYVFYFNGFSK